MDLIDRLRELALRIPTQLEHLTTEEATKNALVLPFISALGYNVFDPTEVVPEFTADVGTKKREKVDYAVMRDGQPIILFECKTSGRRLDAEHSSQLYRYFSVTPARFGVLTNGVHYKFFSDLEEPNKMDSRPFLEFDLREVDDKLAAELKKFAKQSFDLERILSTANELKYTKGITRVFGEEWLNPSEEFVRLFAGRVYSGRMTQAAKEQFTEIVKRAFHEFVNGRINDRLQSALERTEAPERSSGGEVSPDESDGIEDESSGKKGIVTTDEELQGFYVVKAILADTVDVRRIFRRDTLSYCGILLDDNNRKPICRLRFNSPQKYVGVFDDQKREAKHAVDDIDELYRFADQLRQIVQHYDAGQE